MKYYLGIQPFHNEYNAVMLNSGHNNILMTYAEFKNRVQDIIQVIKNTPYKNIIIDSGAFSIWNTGGTIDIKELVKVYNKLAKIRPDITFISLDVIPNTKFSIPNPIQIADACEQSLANYKLINASVDAKVLPVFHQYDEFKYLEMYMQITDYIAISPSNDQKTTSRVKWLDKVYSILKADYKTHSLAGTSNTLLERYPFYSCDSINWKSIVIYGNSKVHSDNVAKVLGRQLRGKSLKDEILYYIELEAYITKLWDKRGIKWQD